MRHSHLILIVGSMVLTACRRDGPEEAYRAFAAAAAKGDTSQVWERLSERSRKMVGVSSGRALEPSNDPTKVKVRLPVAHPPVESVKVLNQVDDYALLLVKLEGAAPQEVEMSREAGAWRVQAEKSRSPRP